MNIPGRDSAMSYNLSGRKKKSKGARKNRLLLSSQGGGFRPVTQISNTFHPSNYSNNLNKLLDEMEKQDE